MKFNCGPTWDERKAKLEQWHDWFAWHPVRIGSHDCRWLETIERKGEFCGYWDGAEWSWYYRPKSPPAPS